MAVPNTVLSWLYSVLHEYHDPQRTYSDLAQTLAAYPSLAPRTEVYTFESGASALLVTLAGTLPVDWRGTTYRFPVKICIPHQHPQHAPMAYVIPTKDMMVRPGQHVGVDGRVYHPYLRDWPNMWNRASIPGFLHLLQQVFAKEPPVISRPQQQQQQQQQQSQRLDGRPQGSPNAHNPPLPPKEKLATSAGTPQTQERGISSPPPLPPKQHGNHAVPESSRNIASEGPPLPPLPPEAAQRQSQLQHPLQGYRSPPPTFVAPPLGYQNGIQQGRPHLPKMHDHQNHGAHRVESPVSPVSPVNGFSQHPEARPVHVHPHPPQFAPQSWQSSPLSREPQQTPSQIRYQNQYPPQQFPQQPQQPQRKQQAPDLLSDPFDVALPNMSSENPTQAPPIPPNPEKEHLLHALSISLVQQTQHKVNQNLSALAPLKAQQRALYEAQERLQSEIRQLEQLDQALSSNEAILHRSIQDCDRAISTAKSKKQPPIDEVLIAPTMVANQLWTLCAEEAACREVMYVLQKGVDRGRVSGHDFVRQMRGLGRECFLKMALARKCARGMGLETQGR